jgi:glutamate 5-kinase
VFAIGLVSYSAHEIRRMRGRRDSEFEDVLGYKYVSYIVDDEDLVVL